MYYITGCSWSIVGRLLYAFYSHRSTPSRLHIWQLHVQNHSLLPRWASADILHAYTFTYRIVQLLLRELPWKVDSTYLLGKTYSEFLNIGFHGQRSLDRTYEEFFIIGYIKRERGIVLVIQSLILSYRIIMAIFFICICIMLVLHHHRKWCNGKF